MTLYSPGDELSARPSRIRITPGPYVQGTILRPMTRGRIQLGRTDGRNDATLIIVVFLSNKPT